MIPKETNGPSQTQKIRVRCLGILPKSLLTAP
jgi:hypothetical protein